MVDNLSDRSKKILEAIIEDYIGTAEPVGSRSISRRHGFSLSPATIRNVMADLEELGFLASPHTSAGRIPTDKAFRFYVDSLLTLRCIDPEQEELIKRQCRLYGSDVGDILKETSKLLSSMSHYMGVVVTPRFNTTIFRHIEFIKLGGRRLLAILVSKSGIVQNKIIETDEDIDSEDLVRMSNYLNTLLEGLSIAELRNRILREMQDEKVLYDEMLAKALRLSEQTLCENGTEIIIEGQVNILDQPEFADVEKMKEIFRTFEEKSQLISLLDRCMESEGVHIFIGSENYIDQMAKMSVITAPYMSGNNTVGVLGVIGPTRMGYDRVIPIVDYTARLLSRLLDME
jgi:heat-inducible transcriptional repressor